MIVGSKNKGDWSEFYVLLYLLGTKQLYAADEQLRKMANFCFPIKKIVRNDAPAKYIEFAISGIDKVQIYINSQLTREMTSAKFIAEANTLYNDILCGKGSFDIPHAEQLLNDMGLERLAAPATNITDIKMELHDTHTGIDQMMGFSIKSYIGGAPTLLNASGATNFIYEVIGLSDDEMNEINAIQSKTKIMDRICAISDFGATIEFREAANNVFAGNLMMIDSRMEEFLAKLLVYSYANNELDCKNLVEYFEEENPLCYPRKGLYIHKFKQFLCAKALGMEPSTEWTGEDEANGGYIVAKADGEVLAYHLYNRDKFKQYLYENTKLERGSTSKHGYASIYKENNKMFIKLNLQIRFK